jgi:predicted PurR-regulated permease PerM
MNSGDRDAYPTSSNPHLWEFSWVRDVFWLGLILAIAVLAWWLRAIVEPVLLALLFAYLSNPVIEWFGKKWKWSRLFTVAVLFALVAGAAVGVGIAVVPLAIEQGKEFLQKLPEYVDALAKSFGLSDETVLQELKDKGAAAMQDPVSNLSYLWDGVVTGFGVLTGFFGTATAIVVGVALFPVYFFYFAWKWPTIRVWAASFIPASCQTRVREIVGQMDKAVGDYFRTRLFIALIMGVMYSVGWGIAGVPYWLLVGMFGGLLGIIPYAAMFAWIAAMVLRFLELENGITGVSDALAVLLWPSLVYGIVQASDDWLLTPWLQGRELEMNFVTIILAVLIGGAVAGLLGMLLAVPAAACVRIFWAEVLRPKLATFAESH